ncbi:hypothetical protein P0Y35_08580 [Kiritimatiellaeota bacterium B1221]|nr:hypothetical protein [Kiritimatiellaeota bacterium B1221]
MTVPKSIKTYLIKKYATIMIRRIAEILRIKPKSGDTPHEK